MTSQSKDKPGGGGPPRWAMVYFLVLGVLIVYGSLILLHGYRQWWVVTFFALAAVGVLGGSIMHRIGGSHS